MQADVASGHKRAVPIGGATWFAELPVTTPGESLGWGEYDETMLQFEGFGEAVRSGKPLPGLLSPGLLCQRRVAAWRRGDGQRSGDRLADVADRHLKKERAMTDTNRRDLLGLGLTGIAAGFAADALAQSAARGDAPTESAPARPAPDAKYRVPFAVIGLDHNHIYGITDAMIRGGGVLTAFHRDRSPQIAMFRARYGDIALARSEDEILDNPAIKLVCSAAIPALRAPLGIRVMRAGKDYLSDKAAITSLKQLAEVRGAIKETGRKFAIMYSERLEVPAAVMAGQLVHDGAIGASFRPSTSPRIDWLRHQPARLVLGHGALRRYPDRYRQPPGRSVRLF